MSTVKIVVLSVCCTMVGMGVIRQCKGSTQKPQHATAPAKQRVPTEQELRTQFTGRWKSEQVVIGTQSAKSEGDLIVAALQQLTEPEFVIDLHHDGTYSVMSTRWVLGSEQRGYVYGKWVAKADGLVLDEMPLLHRGGRLFAEEESGTKIVLARVR